MAQFTLVYADHNDPTNTIEIVVEALDSRWAMGRANEQLADMEGQNAWVLFSMVEAPPVTETPDPAVAP